MRRYITLKAILLVGVVLFNNTHSRASQTALKAGCAKVDITPPVGIWLSGYSSRNKPSDGISDELYAKAIVLDDGQNKIAIVSTDLLWVSLDITAEVRSRIKEKIGIPEKNVLICATHTHFGPKIDRVKKNWPDAAASEIDTSYVRNLSKKITGSILMAYKNMKAAKIGAVRGEIPEIVYNRRTKKADGLVQMTFSLPPEIIETRRIEQDQEGAVRVTFTLPPEGPKLLFGPVDPDVWVLRVEDINGDIIGSIVNFACHAVSGSAYSDWFYSISADFPGQTTKVVEQVEGGICLFTSGTTGNIVPLKRGRGPRYQIGKALAGEVLKRLQLVPVSNDICLKAVKREIKFPVKQTLSPDKIIHAEKTKEYLATEMQVLRIGDIYILGLPGEVLVEVGLEIKKRAGLKNLFIVSLSNDAIGYVCHSQAYEEGGYEPGSGTNLAKGAGEIMIKEALNIINQIKQNE